MSEDRLDKIEKDIARITEALNAFSITYTTSSKYGYEERKVVHPFKDQLESY